MSKKPGYLHLVYFMYDETHDEIKIGYTGQFPPYRLTDLSVERRATLRYIGLKRGGKNSERALHKRFKDHRINGEWFKPHPEILEEIDALRYEGEDRRNLLPFVGMRSDARGRALPKLRTEQSANSRFEE